MKRVRRSEEECASEETDKFEEDGGFLNTGLYVATGRLLILSKLKDKKKTMMALKKAWKAFENILPEFLVLILLVGVLLAVLNPEVISRIIAAILSRLVSKEEVRSIYEAAEKIAN